MLAALLLAPLAPPVELRLTAERTRVAKGEDLRSVFRATLINRSKRPVRLIRLQDGSAWGWSNPRAGWYVSPKPGTPDEPIPRITQPRCGNVNPLTPDSFFVLKPGERSELDLGWLYANPPATGTWHVSLGYEIAAEDGPKGVGATDDPALLDAYRALDRLRVRSNAVRIEVVGG